MSQNHCVSIGCENKFEAEALRGFCDACVQKMTTTAIHVTGTESLSFPSRFIMEDLLETGGEHDHYFRDVSHLDRVDVYRVLKLFEVHDPCLQHLTKKALCSGNRGHKDLRQDLEDIQDSITRALEMMDEDEAQPRSVHA